MYVCLLHQVLVANLDLGFLFGPMGSIVVALGLSCPRHVGSSFPNQELNQSLLH